MAAPDPVLAEITRRFAPLAVGKSRGGYTLHDPHSGAPVARLKPFPDSDHFELLYWSDVRGRWRTFGDFGRMRLTLEDAHEIITAEPLFHLR
jgi:hypothetical protein